MKTICTFRIKVSPSKDKKKLSGGVKKDYNYGSISARSPMLNDYIGQELVVKVFKEDKKKGKK